MKYDCAHLNDRMHRIYEKVDCNQLTIGFFTIRKYDALGEIFDEIYFVLCNLSLDLSDNLTEMRIVKK